jgi:hypothetical protein
MFFSALFQEPASYFAIKMLLLQRASIAEQNVEVKIMEAGSLTESKELVVKRHPQ